MNNLTFRLHSRSSSTLFHCDYIFISRVYKIRVKKKRFNFQCKYLENNLHSTSKSSVYLITDITRVQTYCVDMYINTEQ